MPEHIVFRCGIRDGRALELRLASESLTLMKAKISLLCLPFQIPSLFLHCCEPCETDLRGLYTDVPLSSTSLLGLLYVRHQKIRRKRNKSIINDCFSSNSSGSPQLSLYLPSPSRLSLQVRSANSSFLLEVKPWVCHQVCPVSSLNLYLLTC